MQEISQIYVFFSCVLCGAAGGIIYDIIYIVKGFVRVKSGKIALDILFFLLFALVYVFLSVLFSLPDFRVYMFIACLLGLILYLKSLHRILDFFIKRLYNVIKKK